jgi:HlyD family secretion protein
MPEAAILSFPSRESGIGATAEPANDPVRPAGSRLKRRSHRAFLAITAVLAFCVPLAAFVPISGAVIASGETGSEARFKSIVHPSGGVLAELLVSDGQAVSAGQILMRLATSVTEPGARYAGESLATLLARKARLEAEVQGSGIFVPPAELARSVDSEGQAAMTREQSLFLVKRQEATAQFSMIDDQGRQIQAEMAGFADQLDAIARQRALLAPELQGLRELYQKELVTINRLNEAERSDVGLVGEAATLRSRIAQTKARLAELASRRQSLRETARASAGAELNEVVLALADGRVRQASAADALDRSIIRAPQAGIIEALAFATVGSAIPPGQEILRLIPQTGIMVVHARVAPSDIDQVRINQLARVRFSGFSQQTTPEAAGKVLFVSADRAEDARTGAFYYRVKVGIDAKSFERETGLRLSAGMPAEAFITTSTRSLASYVFKPIKDQVTRAFRDEQ